MEAGFAQRESDDPAMTTRESTSSVASRWESMEHQAQSKVGTKVLQEQRALADKASEDFERRAAKRRDEWEIEEQRAEAEAAKIRAAREEKDREWVEKGEAEEKENREDTEREESGLRKRMTERSQMHTAEWTQMDNLERQRRSERLRHEGAEAQRKAEQTRASVELAHKEEQLRNKEEQQRNSQRLRELQEALESTRNTTSPTRGTAGFSIPDSAPYVRREFPTLPSPRSPPAGSEWGSSSARERLERISVAIKPSRSCKEAWDTDEQRWSHWVTDLQNSTRKVVVDTVPFPSKAALRWFDKDQFKTLALRWHPDRFEAKFGDRMECSQREEIMDCVKEAFQMCNAARR